MDFTYDQKRVIKARNSDLLVSAAAGSGKTAVLVERVIQMISDTEHPLDIDNLLVVTFTKAAAAQMKDKIAKALEEKLQKNPDNNHLVEQINYINRANILTIDSFCYQIVKENFYLLGIDPGIKVGNAGEMGILRHEVLENVIEEFYGDNADFVDFSDAFSADKDDEKIEKYIEKIYDVSASYPRPYLWTEIAKKELAPKDEKEFCDISYVKAYISEVKSSLEGIRDQITYALKQANGIEGPIHMTGAFNSDIAVVDSLLEAENFADFARLSNVEFERLSRGKKGTYDEELADKLNKERKKWKDDIKKLMSVFTVPVSEIIAKMQEQSGMLTALLDAVDAFREQYMKAKLERNILEFSDVEHLALQVLCEGYDDNDIPVPSPVAKELSEHFEEILIDEYQDSNFLQEAILGCVSRHHEGKHNIFMVGDVKQSIYSFRMARPDLFMDKYHSYSDDDEARCRKLLLKNNFRSRANVLNGINYIFYQLMGEDLGGIEYSDDEALIPGKTFAENSDDSVEIMIGESKDFEFLSDDEDVFADKEENLDENLEDIGRMELEASMVSKRIREMMGFDGGKHLYVEEDGEYRPLRYGDIVLLFRTPSSFSRVFFETLMKKGIPVTLQTEKGYFEAVEIRVLLSLLRVVDNPVNDIEFVAVLRGCFCGLDSNEIALFSLIKRELSGNVDFTYYDVYRMLVAKPDGVDNGIMGRLSETFCAYEKIISDSMIPKCRRLNCLLEELEDMQVNHSVSEIVSYIYADASYMDYVSVMPEGKRRIRNLDLFLHEAGEYEKKSYGSLSSFITYIDRLEKKEIELDVESVTEFNDDAVRIMSIHKSKGLEFPVVFLSGMGKQFNLNDTKAPLIIHSDYHIGAKYRNVKKRYASEMFSRTAISKCILTESIAEELRVFYVGLTRAKDKLILTGVTPNIVEQVGKYENIAMRQEQKLSYSNVHTARSYLDFTVMSMIRNASFCDAMKNVRKRKDKKGEHILSAEYENKCPVVYPDCRIAVSIYDFNSLLVEHIKTDARADFDKIRDLDKWDKLPEKNRESIMRALSWKYENEMSARQKSKLSVTEIKRMYEIDFEPSDVVDLPFENMEKYIPPIPEFISGFKPLNAAEKGTWVHKVMELLDFSHMETKEQVDEMLDAMRKGGRIADETKEFITSDMIWRLVDSDFGKRMCDASKKGLLYKEKQFIIGVPVSENSIVVQGIIDAYFREGDKLVLLDYKTDRVKPGDENLLVRRYKSQLQYYKDTLEKLTDLEVGETYIYSFSLGKAIRLF